MLCVLCGSVVNDWSDSMRVEIAASLRSSQ